MKDLSSLERDLKIGDGETRIQAAEELSRAGQEARAAAISLVTSCGDALEEVREWAVAALEDLGPPSLSDLPLLTPLVNHLHPDVAFWAITLLGRLGEKAGAAVPALIEALSKNHELGVRQRAAWALGCIGSPAGLAIDVLAEARKDQDPRLARLAEQAIAKIESG